MWSRSRKRRTKSSLTAALECLTNLFREQDLLDAVNRSINRGRKNREQHREIAEIRQRYDALSVGEREVMNLVVSGTLNKQIAAELGTSEAVVKMHQGQVMRKMQDKSLPELVRMADKLKSMT